MSKPALCWVCCARTRSSFNRSRRPVTFRPLKRIFASRRASMIRRFEEKAGQLYGMGLIGGFCHLYIGQEAVVVGLEAGSRRRRQAHHLLPRSRPHAGLRHGPQRCDGRADGARRRLFQGQRRLHAHVLEREAFLWRPRHRRRAGAAGRGPGLLPTNTSEQRPRDLHLFRRRRGQPGPGLRDLQHGRPLGCCRCFRH